MTLSVPFMPARTRRADSPAGVRRLVSVLLALTAWVAHGLPNPPADAAAGQATGQAAACLPSGDGFFRARVSGAWNAELDWRNRDTECSGAIRPAEDGLRLRFRHVEPDGTALVFVFGITGLKEGATGRALPVNVTVIREGTGDFFATQGDQRCTIDEVVQRPLAGIPLRKRSYRVTARGFCTQPARALNGEGAILITRFDYAGRADFESNETTQSVEKP